MKVNESRSGVNRSIHFSKNHIMIAGSAEKKHDCRATGAFIKVLVIIFDKWTSGVRPWWFSPMGWT